MKTYECIIDQNGNKYHVINDPNINLLDEKFLFNTKDKKLYYCGKLLHNENKPAIEYSNGSKKWFLNGLRHRENGPAVEWDDGSKAWYVNGEKHRLDGPAIEDKDSGKTWYKNGLRHREDGPAFEDDSGYKEYYINGNKLSEQEYKKYLIEKEYKELSGLIENKKDNKQLKI